MTVAFGMAVAALCVPGINIAAATVVLGGSLAMSPILAGIRGLLVNSSVPALMGGAFGLAVAGLCGVIGVPLGVSALTCAAIGAVIVAAPTIAYTALQTMVNFVGDTATGLAWMADGAVSVAQTLTRPVSVLSASGTAYAKN